MSPSESPIQIQLNDEPIEPGIHVGPAGSLLRVQFSPEANATSMAHVVHVPLREYKLDRNEVLARSGEQTDLGDTPSLLYTLRDGSTNINLASESFYDVLGAHNGQMRPTRVVTAEDDIPDGAVIDELKLMIAMKLDLLPSDLHGITAQFIANTSTKYNRNQLAYFGLQVGDVVATIVKEELFDVLFVDAKDKYINHERDELRRYILSRKNTRS